MTEQDRPDQSAGQSDAPDKTETQTPAKNGDGDKKPSAASAGKGGGGNKPSAPKADKPARGGGRGAMAVAVLALLVALAAGAAVLGLGYYGQQRADTLGQRVATAEQAVESNMQDVMLPRVRELEARVDELAGSVEQRGGALSRLQEGVRETQRQITDLTRLVEGGRRHWRLLELEDLLLAANRQLQLHHDPEGARQALELVSQRLGKLNDPRLFDIREMVVDEIAALEALPDPDIEGLSMSLTSLSERVDDLPLASDVPDGYAGDDPGSAEEASGAVESGWRHFLSSVDSALEGMFTIRRSDGEYKPLMPPEQEFFLHQNLQLKLETARLALLQRQPESYRNSLESARKWLRTFFDNDDPAVASTVDKLGQMAKVRIDWQAPDITGSLAALRKFLSREGGQAGDGQGTSGNGQSGGGDGGGQSGGEGE